jgi:hypothetical protein
MPQNEPMVPMTEQLAIQILDDMIEVGVNPAVKSRGVTIGDFFKFMTRNPDLMNLYLSSQQTRAEVVADEIVGISDTELSLDRAKVKIMARQWFSSRILHRKYGDKLQVEHSGTVDMKGALEDAKARAGTVIDVSTQKHAIPSVLSVPDHPGYDRRKDEQFTARLHPGFPLSPLPGEDLVEWGENIVGSLPLDNQPIVVDEIDEDIDIFS